MQGTISFSLLLFARLTLNNGVIPLWRRPQYNYDSIEIQLVDKRGSSRAGNLSSVNNNVRYFGLL